MKASFYRFLSLSRSKRKSKKKILDFDVNIRFVIDITYKWFLLSIVEEFNQRYFKKLNQWIMNIKIEEFNQRYFKELNQWIINVKIEKFNQRRFKEFNQWMINVKIEKFNQRRFKEFNQWIWIKFSLKSLFEYFQRELRILFWILHHFENLRYSSWLRRRYLRYRKMC